MSQFTFRTCIILLFLLQHMIYTCNCKTLYYKISPDDPEGPTYIREQGINDTFIFEFEKFETNSKYQIVLSYPGYLPITCISNITQENFYNHKGRTGKRHDNIESKQIKNELRRRLLDTHVETFVTGNTAIEQAIIKIIVKCKPIDKKAFDQMISSSASKVMRKLGKVDVTKYIVHFAIKVESLWFGIIPNSLVGLLIAVIVIGIIIVFWITPLILRNIMLSQPKY